MLGLTPSELGIVLFIFLLIVVAGKLPRWGEAIGSYFYRRRDRSRGTSARPPAGDA